MIVIDAETVGIRKASEVAAKVYQDHPGALIAWVGSAPPSAPPSVASSSDWVVASGPLTDENLDRLLAGTLGQIHQPEAQQLRLRFELSEFADPDEVVEGVVQLYNALTAAHIAFGGSGLVIDDWQPLVPDPAFEETLV